MQSTQCVSCKHYIKDQLCRAFSPEPIPELVFQGWIIHNHEIEGDRGLRYEAKKIDSDAPDDSVLPQDKHQQLLAG